jgi:LacI family transcriptional regulator
MPTGIPSIADIARQLGVAPSTVSKVLGPHAERYRITPELRQRILACAKALGYRPDLRNRARATRRSGMVGVLYSSPSPTTHVVFEYLGTHLAHHLGRHGYRTCYLPAGDWQEVRSRLAEHRVDGCLLLPHLPRKVPGVRHPESLPLVVINALTDLPVPQVVTDDVQGVGLLVDHLVDLGHRRIAYADVQERPFGHYSEAWRRQGYRQAMERHGLPLQEHAGEAADLLPWLEGHGGTAAITYNHQIALDLTREIRRRGLSVPGRFSFACASDIAVGALVDPAWTAVRIPLAAMVARAVEELVARMEGRKPLGQERIVIAQDIVVRDSTGAAPPA